MTVRWVRGGGFELGFGVRWGDNRRRSSLFAAHLGVGSVLILVRWWL